MASFLENAINNAANKISGKIKEKIEDGSVNRMAEDFGNDINSLAAGMAGLVAMAGKAFGKLRGRDTDDNRPSKANDDADYERPAQAYNNADYARPAREDYERPARHREATGDVELLDAFMARLGKQYVIEGEDVYFMGMARLMVLTGLFFANCDGIITKRERQCIDGFKDWFQEDCQSCTYDSGAVEHLFDDLEQAYTIDEIIEMTRWALSGLNAQDRKGLLDDMDHFIREVIETDLHDGTEEEDYYKIWRRELL